MKQLKTINIHEVVANPYQPRMYFDEIGIDELAKSIHENGLIQPISVREKNGKYEIVVGERRFRALSKLQLEEIEVYVIDDDETSTMNKALIENIQRVDLSALEEAKAYVRIMQYQRITQTELAKSIGKSQSSIANKIRLLNLNENVQNAVEAKKISERHARAMLSLKQEEQQDMLDDILKNKLNVEQTEKKIKKKQNIVSKKIVKGYTRNIKIAINTLKQAMTMLAKSGVEASFEEKEFDEYVSIEIKIKK